MYQNSLFVSDANEFDLYNYGWKMAPSSAEMAVRFVRGHKMRTANRLFDEVAATCQFPYYFGENWPALAECLGDLDWIGSRQFVLIITRFDEVLVEEPREIGALSRALRSMIEEYNSNRRNLEGRDSLFRIIASSTQIDSHIYEAVIAELGAPTILRI